MISVIHKCWHHKDAILHHWKRAETVLRSLQSCRSMEQPLHYPSRLCMYIHTHIQMYNITYNIPIYTGAHIHIKYTYIQIIYIYIYICIYIIYVSGISICCWVTGVTARMRKRKAKVKGQRRRGVSDPDLHLKITVLNQQMGSNGIE